MIRWGRRRLLFGVLGGALAAVLVAAVVLLVVMFRPGEQVSLAVAAYPPPVEASARVYARLRAMPLVLDRRLRVFAVRNLVWAEPLTAADDVDPFWSVRRWPHTVLGIVAAGEHGAAPAMVVAKWSDGDLTGIDARSGAVVWRRNVELGVEGDHHDGGPTGIYTAYGDDTLTSLYTSRGQSGNPVVINMGVDRIRAFDPASGEQLWTVDLSACPHGTDWTSSRSVAVVRFCGGREVLYLYDAATGAQVSTWRPNGDSHDDMDWGYHLYECQTAASGCGGFNPYRQEARRVNAAGRSTPDPVVERGMPAGPSVVFIDDDKRTVIGLDRDTGKRRWRQTLGEPVWIGAADRNSVYLGTAHGRELLRLDASTGQIRARVNPPLPAGCLYWYATDGFVAVDCSMAYYVDVHTAWTVPPDARPVLLIGVGP